MTKRGHEIAGLPLTLKQFHFRNIFLDIYKRRANNSSYKRYGIHFLIHICEIQEVNVKHVIHEILKSFNLFYCHEKLSFYNQIVNNASYK